MRMLNLRFAACLVLLLLAMGLGVFFLHRIQFQRISDDLLWQVDRAHEAGKSDEAISLAYRYLDFRPDDSKVLVQLADWLEKRPGGRRHLASIIGLLEHALRVTPERDDIRRRVVALDMRLGQYGECLDHLERLMQDAPNDAELLNWLGECKQWTGNHSEAAQAYAKAIKADPKRIKAYVEYADLLSRHLRRPEDARRTLDSAIAAHPQSAEARLALARHFRALGQFAEAESAVAEAVKLAPENARMVAAAGEIVQAGGKIRSARDYFQKACTLDPKNSRYACTLAWLMLYDGKTVEAGDRVRAILADNPNDVDALTLLGDILALDGKIESLERVVEDAEKARRIAPHRAWNADYLRARLLMRRSEWTSAAALLDQLRIGAAKLPNLARQASYLQAQCFEQLGDRNGELEAYRHVIDADNHSGFYRLEFCRALTRAGQFEEAASQFRAAIQRTDLPARSVTSGIVDLVERCQRSGTDKVVNDLERSLAPIKGDDSNINPVLAKVELARLRRHEADALKTADPYLAKHPNHAAMHAARARVLCSMYGCDQALSALADATARLGDLAEFRVARLQIIAMSPSAGLSSQLMSCAANLDQFSPEDRSNILVELVAATGAAGDHALMGRALEMLRAARPDHLGVRSVLLTRALGAGDEAAISQLLAEVSATEGPHGWTSRRFAAERLVKVAHRDQAAAARAREVLAELAQARPGDPLIEYFTGRLDEIEDRPSAVERYRAALDRGLLDHPIEEQFWTLGSQGSDRKVRVLIQDSPLIERLRLEQDRAVVRSLFPLVGASERAVLADRLLRANATASAPQLVWLSTIFQQCGVSRFADTASMAALKASPRSADVWSARFAICTARDGRSQVGRVIEEAKQALGADASPAMIGRALQLAGFNAEAASEFKKAIDAAPRDTESRWQLAQLYLQSGRVNEARETLRAIVDRPDTPDDQRRAARRALAINLTIAPSVAAYRESMQLLEANKGPEQFSDDDLRAIALVSAVQRDRDLGNGVTAQSGAISILQQLEVRSPKPVADDLVLLARLTSCEANPTTYRRVCERLDRECRDDFAAMEYLTRTALQNGNMASANRNLATLWTLGSNRIETVALSLARHGIAGNVEAGLAEVKTYIAAAPEGASRMARTLRSGHLIFDFLQNYPLADKPEVTTQLRLAAIQFYESALGRDPNALLRLVSLLGRAGQTDRAFDLLMTPAIRKSFSTEAIAAAFVAAVRNGSAKPQQIQAVEKQLAEWMRKTPQSTALTLASADLCDHQRQQEKAAELYRTVLSREPSNVMALNNLAWILSHDPAKVDESLRMVQTAIDQTGPLADLLDTRSRIRFAKGDRDGGLADLTEAIHEAPTAARYLQMALFQRQLGRTDLADRALHQARRFGLSQSDVHPLDLVAYRELVPN